VNGFIYFKRQRRTFLPPPRHLPATNRSFPLRTSNATYEPQIFDKYLDFHSFVVFDLQVASACRVSSIISSGLHQHKHTSTVSDSVCPRKKSFCNYQCFKIPDGHTFSNTPKPTICRQCITCQQVRLQLRAVHKTTHYILQIAFLYLEDGNISLPLIYSR